MASEAVVRVQRTAGTLGRTIKDVRDEVAELSRSLESVDPRLGKALQSIEAYRRQVRDGGQLSERERANYHNLTEFVQREGLPRLASTPMPIGTAYGVDTTRAFQAHQQRIADRVGQIQAYIAQPLAAAAAPKAAPAGAAPAGSASRPLTPEERAGYQQRGISDDELDRSRMLGTARLVRPPRSNAEPDSPGAKPDSDPIIPGQQTPHAVADEVTEAADRATAAVVRRTDKQRKLREQQDLSSLSERELRREWQRTQVDLRAQDRDIDRSIGQLDKLRERKRRGFLDDDEQLTAQRSKVEDLRHGRAALHAHAAQLKAEAESRGMQPEGDKLLGGGGGGGPGRLQQSLGALVSGAGLGSGSIGGGIMGMALGNLSPWTAVPLMAGAMAAKGWRLAEDAYGTYVAQLERTEPIGRTVGRTGGDLVQQSVSDAWRYGVFGLPELYQGMQAASRGLGSADLNNYLPMASVTGYSPSETVQQHLALTRLAPSLDPTLQSRLLAEFGGSNVPGAGGGQSDQERQLLEQLLPQQETEEQRAVIQNRLAQLSREGSLGFDTALFGHWQDVVARTGAGMGQPLTRIPLDALAAQLGAASFVDVPGIDMAGGGPIAADVAGEMVGGLNRWVGRSASGAGGALEDARLLAVTKLRGSEMAQRLKEELDIDIDTIPGALRAMERAPELSMRGYPELAQGMLGAERGLFSDQSMYEMALRRSGVGGEMAHLLATRDVEHLYGIQPTGPMAGLDDRAAAIAGSPDAQRVFEWGIHPELRQVQAGATLDDSGLAINREWNDIKTIVADKLSEGADQLTRGVLAALHVEISGERGESAE